MSSRTEVTISKVKQSGLIAIIRGKYEYDKLVSIADTLSTNGVKIMELTLNSLNALPSITRLKNDFGDKIILGAGTVRNSSELSQVIEAGAEFSIAPNLDLDSIALAKKEDFLHLPGVFTATEIQNAYKAGSRLVKLFPSDVLGPKYLKALRAPLDDIDIVPTGGISAENLHEYISAGAVAVGVASSLVTSPEQSTEDLSLKTKALVSAWNKVKGG